MPLESFMDLRGVQITEYRKEGLAGLANDW
jgi:hypothetical protein